MICHPRQKAYLAWLYRPWWRKLFPPYRFKYEGPPVFVNYKALSRFPEGALGREIMDAILDGYKKEA